MKYILISSTLLIGLLIGVSIASNSYLIPAILITSLILVNMLIYIQLDKMLLILVSVYWLPLIKILTPISSLYDMYLFESGTYLLFFLSLSRIFKIDRTFLRRQKMFLLGYLLFITGSLITSLYADMSGLLISRLRLIVILPIIMFFVIEVLIRNHAQLKNIALAYALTTGLIALIFFLLWYFGVFTYTNSGLNGARLSLLIRLPFFDNNLEFEPTTLATMFAVPLPFILGLLINERSSLIKYLLIASFCAICILLAFTQGRAGWLAGGCGCLLLLALQAKEISQKTLSFAIPTIFVSVVVWILRPIWEQKYSSTDLTNRLYSLVDNPLSDPNYLFRINQFSQRWELISKNPMGLNLIDVYTPNYYVHSLYFFLAIGIGVIGLTGFLLMIITSLVKYFNVITHAASNSRRYAYASIGLGCISAWLIGGVSEPLGLVSGLSTIMLWLSYFLSFKGSTLSEGEG